MFAVMRWKCRRRSSTLPLMHTRTFGRTGWQVSEIGFGAWGIGGGAWGGAGDAESMAAVQEVYDSLVRPLIHHRW